MKVEIDWLKKNLPSPARVRRELVEPGNERISIKRQCEMLGLNRSTLCYRERLESEEDARLIRLLDEQYTAIPFYDYRLLSGVFTAVRILGQS